MTEKLQQRLSVAVESLRESWRSVTRNEVIRSRDGRRTVGAKGINCRVGESIFDREVKNLSRGSDTIEMPVAENVLSRKFNPTEPNQVWSVDITYLWTQEGWIYLAVVIDLYSHRVVGWAMDRRMKKALVLRALLMATNLR